MSGSSRSNFRLPTAQTDWEDGQRIETPVGGLDHRATSSPIPRFPGGSFWPSVKKMTAGLAESAGSKSAALLSAAT